MTRSTLRAVVLAAAAIATGCEATEPSEPPEQQARTVTVEIGRSSQAGDGGTTTQPRGDRGAPPSVPGDDTCPNAGDPTSEDNVREAEIAVRCLTNAVRREKGLAPLSFDERLARAAATRSNDMVEQRYFAHVGPDGGDVRRAVRRTGWIPDGQSWLLGENIGWAGKGRATPADLMRSWLDSPTHRENILKAGFESIGVGAIAGVPREGAEPGATFTQVFGARGEAARRAQGG